MFPYVTTAIPAHTHPDANEWAYILSGEGEESSRTYTTGTGRWEIRLSSGRRSPRPTLPHLLVPPLRLSGAKATHPMMPKT